MAKRLAGRIIALIPAILLQATIIVLLCTVLEPISTYIYLVLNIVAVITAIWIISQENVSAYKQVWMLFILLVPIFGILMYILFGSKKTGEELKKNINKAKEAFAWKFPKSNVAEVIKPGPETIRSLESMYYVNKLTDMGVYHCGPTKYYPLGDDCWQDLLEDLKKAKQYIYMEYFILHEGKFMNSLVDVLIERARAGVDVRIMYDDLGSLMSYSPSSAQKLRDQGIKVLVFNKIKRITPRINNRDHRKMTVIDGNVVYSGGINIADEYVNINSPYGHWKDIVFRMEGDAVINFVYMFTEFWNAFSDDKIGEERLPDTCTDAGTNGYIMSYYESPLTDYHVSNELYIDLLSQATEYVYFYTPYLMLDDSLMNAFIYAARRGIDVRIIVPGIPDKKIAYRATRSYYGPLLEAGVRIFEYAPGFVHAKACVCDGRIATIGTVNLDYRSLFLHFENNSIFYGSTIVEDIHKDMVETIDKCVERKIGDGLPGTRFGMVEALLRVIAPLM